MARKTQLDDPAVTPVTDSLPVVSPEQFAAAAVDPTDHVRIVQANGTLSAQVVALRCALERWRSLHASDCLCERCRAADEVLR